MSADSHTWSSLSSYVLEFWIVSLCSAILSVETEAGLDKSISLQIIFIFASATYREVFLLQDHFYVNFLVLDFHEYVHKVNLNPE